jgi:hypothetical protein
MMLALRLQFLFLAKDDFPFEWEAYRRTCNDRSQVGSA